MAKVQYSYLQKKKSESGQTGTVTYDLPEKGFMPELVLVPYSTPTASTDPALPLSEAITSVKIMDGGTTIKSLNANQLKGLAMIHGRKEMVSPEVNDNAVEGHDVIHIPLGAKVNGVEYAPDMSQFKNPQIEISWDYSLTTGHRGATYDADTSPNMKFTLLAKLVREGGKYTHGYVKSTQLKTWTQAVSTETTIDLPTNGQLLGFGIVAGYDAKEFTDDVNQLKLDFDNGAWVPFEFDAEEVVLSQQEWFGTPFKYSFTMDLIDAVEIDTHMGYVTNITGTAHSSAGRTFEYDGVHKGVEAVGFMDVATPTAISTYEQVTIETTGYMPFGMWYCPAKVLTNGDGDLLDLTKYSRVRITSTSSASASTSSTPEVVAEYLMK